jgi:hypothetical protein
LRTLPPTPGKQVPSSADWIHEIKHDGDRLIVQRERPALDALVASTFPIKLELSPATLGNASRGPSTGQT